MSLYGIGKEKVSPSKGHVVNSFHRRKERVKEGRGEGGGGGGGKGGTARSLSMMQACQHPSSSPMTPERPSQEIHTVS
jgi:hypothetical protein